MKLPESTHLRWASLFGAGVVCSAFLAALIWIVWKGGWSLTQQPEQLRILGFVAFGFLGLLAVVLVALAAVNVKGSAGPVSLEIDGDGE